MSKNGLRSYAFHADEKQEAVRVIRPARSGDPRALSTEDLSQQDPEVVARGYLGNALQSESLPSLTLAVHPEFALLGIERSTLRNTSTVMLRQTLHGIPVAGSLATIEMDYANELVCLSSELGEPQDLSPEPGLSPDEALAAIQKFAGVAQNISPRLYYYFHVESETWRLVYIAEDVFFPENPSGEGSAVPFADVIIDAYDGRLVDISPRACAVMVTAVDATNRPRQIQTTFDPVTAGQNLHDSVLNIHTQDFGFRDVGGSFNNLPGPYVQAPPLPWNPMAVSAHANAELVASFLINVLGRRGLDGRGGPLVSSINCVWAAMGSSGRNWPNSFWIKDQAVFGQRQSGAQVRSFAAALDMVAHEFFHGVTQYSSRLDMKGQTGALNESYSDIFAVLIANGMRPDWSTWRWEIGTDTGAPLRDMSAPGRFNQPEHMNQYQNLPMNIDFGGIHVNCGIHNKAAYNIMTARDPQGRFLFAPKSIAQIFYKVLTAPLPPAAVFSHSRRMVEVQARTVLAGDPQINLKLNAISDGFNVTGIV